MKSFLRKYGFWLLLFLGAYLFGSSLIAFKHKNKYIWSDAEGYYMYAPAVLLYGGFEDFPVRTKVQFKNYPGTNKIFTKYTYGVALLEAPFFLIAVLSRTIQGSNVYDYEGGDYSVLLLLGACFYGVLGLFFLRKTLSRHFQNKWAINLALAVLLLGTNLLHYMTRSPGMSHIYSFFLIATLVFMTPLLFEANRWRNWLMVGLIFGLIVVIRPTNAVVILYPLLYGVSSWEGCKARWRFLAANWGKLLLALTVTLMAWIPQLVYWHYVTGNWIYYSYKKEGFDFLANPQIGKVLFSPLNGWLIYNPILVFPLLGMPFLLRRNYLNGCAIFLVFAISTYLYASWWCWWFGGALGQRNYADIMALFSIPMTYLTARILENQPTWVKVSYFTLLVLFCFLNIRFNIIYNQVWSVSGWGWDDYQQVLMKAFFLE